MAASSSSQPSNTPQAEPRFEEFMKENILRMLRNGKCTDCTLIAGNAQIEAHKTILAANSPLFERILTEQEHVQHPTFFFDKMDQSVLNWLVEMIYTGKITVPADQVDKFLEILRYFELPYTTNGDQQINSVPTTVKDYSSAYAAIVDTSEDLFKPQDIGKPIPGQVYVFSDSSSKDHEVAIGSKPLEVSSARRLSQSKGSLKQFGQQHVCIFCLKSLPSSQYLRLHLDYCQSNPNRLSFHCNLCNVSCANAAHFDRHNSSRAHARNAK